MRVLWFGKNFMQARLPAVPWNGYGRGCARSYLNHVGQSRCTYLRRILEQPQLYTFIIIRSEGKYIVKHYGTHSVVVTHLRHGSAVRAETHYYEIGWRPFSYHWTDPGESWSRIMASTSNVFEQYVPNTMRRRATKFKWGCRGWRPRGDHVDQNVRSIPLDLIQR